MIMALTVALTATAVGVVEVGSAEAEDALPAHQLLYFNHAYGVIDRATADAVEDSAYLRRFANFSIRTSTGTGGVTWTGRYLMGRSTYLELFGEGDLPGQDAPYGPVSWRRSSPGSSARASPRRSSSRRPATSATATRSRGSTRY
jgi:hypothetical protein